LSCRRSATPSTNCGGIHDLGEHLEIPWTLVGGQMVLLHAVEHGTVPPQLSQDGDVIADIRAAPSGLRKVVVLLGQLGFTLEGIATDGTAHRYGRPGRKRGRPVVIDVLAPDGVGARADLTTTNAFIISPKRRRKDPP
jgi:hypothetical protein